MLSRRSLVSGFAFAAGPALAQGTVTPPAAPDPQKTLFTQGRYLPLRAAVLAAPDERNNRQIASFFGDEAVALASRSPAAEVALAPDARAEDAVAAIRAAAQGRRVVFLNEGHSVSRHRLFLAQLLRALRPDGFSVLAVETLTNDGENERDARNLKRGAAFPPSTGYYTWDPVFAEALREALDLGYRLAPYEQRADQRGKGEQDSAARIAAREIAQAENLAKIIAATGPQERILIYCGFSHLRKTPDKRGNVWAAQRLAEATGIDPLSVSQAYTGSFGPHGVDPAPTRAVLERFSPRTSVVVRSGGESVGAVFAGADLALFHPSLPDVDGRPGWLAADPVRRRFEVAVRPRAAGEAVIVQAVHAGDLALAVPADQQVLVHGEERAVLFLRPGSYRLRLETNAGFEPLGEVTV